MFRKELATWKQKINILLQKEKKEKDTIIDTDVGSGRSIPIRQVWHNLSSILKLFLIEASSDTEIF